MELRRKNIEELIDLKDNCHINGCLERERIDEYASRIKFYKGQGYKIRIHELVLEIFYEKLNGTNSKPTKNR